MQKKFKPLNYFIDNDSYGINTLYIELSEGVIIGQMISFSSKGKWFAYGADSIMGKAVLNLSKSRQNLDLIMDEYTEVEELFFDGIRKIQLHKKHPSFDKFINKDEIYHRNYDSQLLTDGNVLQFLTDSIYDKRFIEYYNECYDSPIINLKEKIEQARIAIQNAKNDKELADKCVYLANYLFLEKEYDEATSLLNKAYSLDNSLSSEIYLALGCIKIKQGKNPIAELEKSIEIYSSQGDDLSLEYAQDLISEYNLTK